MEARRSSCFLYCEATLDFVAHVVSMALPANSAHSNILLPCLLIVVLLGRPLAPPPAVQSQVATPNPSEAAFAPGEILVGWQVPDLPVTEELTAGGINASVPEPAMQSAIRGLENRTHLTVLEAHPQYGLARLAVPIGLELEEATRLAGLPEIQYAEPNYRVQVTTGPGVDPPLGNPPSDPLYGSQWNLARVGAPEAWGVTEGSKSVVVAMIGTGIDFDHPEFAGRILPGYDYANYDSRPDDDNGSGTFLAGVLAAASNNGIGMAGMAPHVSMLPLKVFDASGWGWADDTAAAIWYATERGARIIVLDMGFSRYSAAAHDAVKYATQHNVLVVASAGNCARSAADRACFGRINGDSYPAAYPEVLAVAATDRQDNWAEYSNHRGYVGLAAPGGTAEDRIVGARLGGGYRSGSGTGAAAALVAGAAALIWSLAPDATQQQVAELLRNSADKVGLFPYENGRNEYYGYGRLNAARAVQAAACSTARGLISGLVWVDEDGDGLRSSDEPVVPDHRVCAEPMSRRPPTCTQSDSQGIYRLCVLPGTYLVAPDPALPGGRAGQWGFRLPVVVRPASPGQHIDLGFLPARIAGTPPHTPAHTATPSPTPSPTATRTPTPTNTPPAELMMIDFEGLDAMTYFGMNPIPPSARLSDAFLITHGVRFSSGSPYVAVVNLGVGHATSGTNGIGGSTPSGVLTYDRQYPVVMSFFDPSNPSVKAVTDFVSVRGDLQGIRQSITLNAFDVDGNLIASFTTTDDGGATLSISAPGIHSVQFLGTQDDCGVALDDLTFRLVRVP